MEKNLCGDVDLPPLFSEDVLIQILVCLPVKSLLQFKSVCKSWRELIQSSFFIDLHINTLNSSSSSSKFGSFIIQTMEYSRRDEYFELEIKLFKLSSSGSGDGDGDGDGIGEDDDKDEDDDDEKKKMVFKVDGLEFSPFYKDFMLTAALRIVGSCNGIICLHNPDVIMDHHNRGYRKHQHDPDDLRDVYLWNPATRQFKILPKPIPIEEKQYYIGNRSLVDFVAFGFDVKTKDYKVMCTTATTTLTPGEVSMIIYRVQVYSLRTDSWRLLEDIHYLPVMPDHRMSPSHHGIYMNGSYFFVARRKLVFGRKDWIWMMLSFDFTKEIFTTMELPDDNIPVLSCVDEKLAVFTTRDGGYDIWVLNEQHGSVVVVVNKKSWTKLHSFQVKSIGNPYTQPRCISNNGEFALISTEKNQLQLFNLVTKETIKDFTIGYGVLRADVHQESLVSIMSSPSQEWVPHKSSH